MWYFNHYTIGPVHKLRYHNMGGGPANDSMGGQNPGRYNIIYGQEYFKNLEKVANIGKK